MGELSSRYKYSSDRMTFSCPGEDDDREDSREKKLMARSILEARVKGYLATSLSTDLLRRVRTDINILQSLKLCGFDLGDRGALLIGKALASNHSLLVLDIGFNGITDKGLVAVAKALETNQTLTTLYLSGNCIGVEGAADISRALQVNSTLQALYLSGNGITDEGALHLATALKTNNALKSLYLGTNNLGVQGMMHIADALPYNRQLRELMLGQNHLRAAGLKYLVAAFMTSRVSLTTLEIGLNEIDSAGALALAEALHISTNTLENLYMDNNPIGDVGASALGVCIANSSTLRVVDLSYCNLSLLGLRDVSLGLRKSTSLMGLLVEGHDWSSTKYMVRPPPNITALSKADALQYAAKCIITAMHMNPALPLLKLTGINLGYAADIETYPVTLPEPLELAASHAVCALNEAVLDCIRAQEASPDEGQTQLAQQQQHQQQEQEAAHTAYILTESRKVLAKIAALHFDADELQALCQYYCPDLICEGVEEPSTKRRRLSLELAPDNMHVSRLAIYPRVERRLVDMVRDEVTVEVKQQVLTVLRQLHYLVKSLHSVDHSVALIETLLGDADDDQRS